MMQSGQPLVEIVIPNWNGREMLSCCLTSLEKQTCQNFSVTVVDNGSTDGSLAFLSDNYPEVKVIPFPENRGFSVAVNEGIEHASAPWIFLLNNDIEVADTCIEQIGNAIQLYPAYDSFAVKMVDFNERDFLDGAGDEFLRGGAGYRLGTMEKDNSLYSTSREVFGACAGAAVYSRRFFDLVGVFDNDFFAYLEDVDLNVRARRRGLKCFYIADAVVFHIGSATTGSKINPFTIAQSTKNSLHVLTKNYPVSLLFRFIVVILIYQFIWFVFCVKKGKVLSYFRGLYIAVKETPVMLKKRRSINNQDNLLSSNEFANILSKSENEVVRSIMSRRSSANKGNALLNLYRTLFL